MSSRFQVELLHAAVLLSHPTISSEGTVCVRILSWLDRNPKEENPWDGPTKRVPIWLKN